MLHDPMRAQSFSLIAGCVLAVVAVAVCAILAFLRPHAGLGDAAIVMSRESGALYVRVGDTLHPVLNLASARLVAGTGAGPEIVSAADIDKAKRGPLLGTPGAPAVIAKPLTDEESAWTVCDGTTTTVIAGHPDGIDRAARQPTRSGNSPIGERGNDVPAVRRLAGGSRPSQSRGRVGATARRYRATTCFEGAARCHSRGAADHVAARRRCGQARGYRWAAGRNGGAGDAGRRQRLFRRAGRRRPAHRRGRGGSDPNRRLARQPRDRIGLARCRRRRTGCRFPAGVDVSPTGGDDPWALAEARCCARSGCRMDRKPLSVVGRLAAAADSNPIELVQADGEGPNVDNVVMPPGRSAYVRAAALTGDGGETGPLYLVTDSGVLFGMHDEDTAKLLGVQGDPVSAPWPVLSRLPRGPELSRDSALVARDSVLSPP